MAFLDEWQKRYQEDLGRQQQATAPKPTGAPSFLGLWSTQDNPEARKRLVNYASQQKSSFDISKQKEEEQRKQQELAQRQAEKQNTLGAKTGRLISGAGEAIAQPFVQAGRGVARVLPGGTADFEAATQQSQQQSQFTTEVARKLQDPNLPAKQKEHYQKILDNLQADKSPAEAIASVTSQLRDDVDKSAFIGSLVAIGSFGLPVAKGAQVLKGGTQAAKAVGVSAGGGAVGGAGYEASANPDVSIGQLAKGAAIGGVAGAALPIVGAGIRQARQVQLPALTESRLGQAVAQKQFVKKIGSLKDGFVAKVIDDTNFIKKPFKNDVDSATGRKVTDEIEDRVTNIRQFAGLAQDRLQNNQAYQGLVTLINRDKQRAKDFGSFISAKQDAINNQKLGKGGTIPKGTPEQEQAYQLLNQATKDDLQYLYDNGRISKQKYDAWINDPDYTRVQREILDDQKQVGKSGFTPSAKGVTEQKLKGSSKKAIDPFVAYEDWQRSIVLEAEKNNLAKYLRDRSVEKGISNKVDTTTAGYERIKQLYGEEGLKQETLGVFENGIRDLYTIDPKAARQLAKSSDLELKAIADWVLFPSRVLRGGATSMNLAFAIPNFVRDQISSGIISQKARATHNPIAMFQGIKEAVLKPAARATIGKLGAKEAFKPSPLFQEYLKRNANMTSVDLARNLKDAARLSQENLGLKGESLLRRYENIISAGEKATRYQNFIGTYKNALKNNIDPEQALQRASMAARRNSINFSNRGEISQFMKIFNPYFNAGVQGSKTLAGALKNRPIATSMKIGAGILLPVASATYYNLSDPERAEMYANIPEYERKANLIMVLGSGKGYVKVPLPPGIREFGNPLRNYIESEYLGDRQGFLTTAKDILVDPFSPVGTTGREVLSQAVPQAVKPAVELGFNQEFYTGREIIPENLKDLPKEEQVFSKTPQIYRDIGKTLGMSPLQVRKLVTGYGAGATEGALTTPDAIAGRETGGRSTLEQIKTRFASPPPSDGQSQVKSKFYDTYTPLSKSKISVSEKVTSAVKSNNIGEANRLARAHNEKIDKEKARLRETYGKFESDLTPLYDRFDSLKFPIENDQLKKSSIKARQRQ